MSIRNKLYLLSESDPKDKLLTMPFSIKKQSSSTTITPARPPTSSSTPVTSKVSNVTKHDPPNLKRRLSSSSSCSASSCSSITPVKTTMTTAAPTKKPKPTKCITHSELMVKAIKSKYRPFFTQTNDDTDDSPRSSPLKDDYVLTLEYPGVGEYESFLLLKPVKLNARQDDIEEDNDEYHPINDIYQTAFWIHDCYLTPSQQERLGDGSHGIMRNLTKYRNRRNGPRFAHAVDEFNKVIRELKAAGEISRNAKQLGHPSYDLTCHILYQVYSRTVAHQADALNNYQAFSNYVYGEINASLVNEFITKTNMTSKSVFMDLGCGIGNVVLQVAAQTGCESYGIEIMETPCKMAKRQLKEYATRMKAWSLPTGKVHFRHGDFLDTAANDMYTTMKRADVLLVNNYAFDATTNHSLAQMFLDLKEGTKIISLKSFVPKHHKINQRTLDMPESILKVEEFEYYSEAVSWTNNSGMYYLATVDRSRLKPFYDALYPK